MIVPKLRRQARELALQVLFQQEFSPTLPLDKALDQFKTYHQAQEKVWSYATTLLEGIGANKTDIDASLESFSAHWTLERMALVELNIMRVAAYEIMFLDQEVPPKTAINEAIEISKKYGSTESGSYVNGVLDQLRKSKEK